MESNEYWRLVVTRHKGGKQYVHSDIYKSKRDAKTEFDHQKKRAGADKVEGELKLYRVVEKETLV